MRVLFYFDTVSFVVFESRLSWHWFGNQLGNMSATLAESQVLEPRGLAVPSLGSVDASNNTPADQHPKRDGHDQIAAGSAPAAVTSRSAVGLDVQNDNEDGHSEPWKWTEKDFRRIAGLRIDDSWMDIDLQLTEDALAQPSEEAERT